jgi:hypothetical protein
MPSCNSPSCDCHGPACDYCGARGRRCCDERVEAKDALREAAALLAKAKAYVILGVSSYEQEALKEEIDAFVVTHG